MTDRKLLEKILQKIGNMDSRMDSMDSKMDSMDSRMNSIESKMDSMDSRMNSIKSKMDSMDSRMNSMETEMADIKADVKFTKGIVAKIENDHGQKLGALFDGYIQNSEKLNRIEVEVSMHEEIILKRLR
jgi:peptidoglycan hydrolase CwlO-like protein